MERSRRCSNFFKETFKESFCLFGREQGVSLLSKRLLRSFESYPVRNFLPPSCSDPPRENETIVLDEIVRHERLGGLIKWYQRAA